MFFFELRKRTKKRGGLRFPPHHPKRPLAKRGKGSTKNNRQKGFVKFWHKTFSFVFLFFVLHETKNLSRVNCIWVHSHSNSWQTFLFHTISLTRRVKAKNAITLEEIVISFDRKNPPRFARGSGWSGESWKFSGCWRIFLYIDITRALLYNLLNFVKDFLLGEICSR